MGKARKYILIAGDIILLYVSLWLTLIIRYQKDYSYSLWSQHFWPFTAVFLIWLIIFYIDDLYELGFNHSQINLLNRFLRDMAVGVIFAIFFFYLGQNRLFEIRPQTVLLIETAIVTISIFIWRSIFNYLIKSPKIANGLMIIGFNDLAKEIIDEINQKPQLGFQLKAMVLQPNLNSTPENLKNITSYNHFENLKDICLEKKISTIISTVNPRQNSVLLKSLFYCLPLKINFFDIATFYEKITGKIPVTTIEQIWFLENLTANNKKIYEGLKRIFDIIFSLILLIISLPLIPLIALAVKLDSDGPIFFTQKRVGKDGKTFTAIKFRSMIVEAEKNGPQWATKDDLRVTGLGKIMRKTRIDEIPQLINVLRGEMSLIGPRPERPEFIEELQTQIPFYKERLLVKPGLTGWAQVMGPAYGGSQKESLEKLQYDLFYIKNCSLGLDLSIMLKTIRTVLSTKGQ